MYTAYSNAHAFSLIKIPVEKRISFGVNYTHLKTYMIIDRAVTFLFYALFFFVPLILYPHTSEVFEFNKMVLTYLLTVLIVSAWAAKMVLQRKFLFRRTILDIPLLIFLGSQVLSTLTSIDFRTSLLGYYSRFNGGLASSVSYSLLYWAYVSNMDRGKNFKSIYILLGSAVLVSIYGVLEHFGIDRDLWVQDVQNRVFSTLGQPNWLAAWLAALTPIAWAFTQKTKYKIRNVNVGNWIWIGLSALFFLTLLYTKSRSGLLGFVVAFVSFWVVNFWLARNNFRAHLRAFATITFSLLIIALLVGTAWTPSLSKLLKQPTTNNQQQTTNQGPALEVGGTESGTIRKIVWKGAVEIWKHYPLTGSGPETFAFAYYMFRPVEHNLVSEWDFLYNKAHNEYLNYLANTGAVGFVAYVVLIVFAIYQIFKLKSQNSKVKTTTQNLKSSKFLDLRYGFELYALRFALLAGYISILVSNFFGFSVVPTSIQFFLFPAMAATANYQLSTINYQQKKLSTKQKFLLLIVVSCLLYVVSRIAGYWYADVLFAKARLLNDQQKFVEARGNLIKATALSPNEAIFYSKLSESDVGIAVALDSAGEKVKYKTFIDAAISESNVAVGLSPANLNLKRNKASTFIKLSVIDPKYLNDARDVLLDAIAKAPTDAKLFYNLGLTYARLGNIEAATKTLEKTIELKPNYRDARLAYALILIDKGQIQQAKEQLLYILEKINPNDSLAKQQLEELK